MDTTVEDKSSSYALVTVKLILTSVDRLYPSHL